MPVEIKTSVVKYKNSQGEYVDVNGFDSSFIDDTKTTDPRHAWSGKKTQEELNKKLDANQRGAANGVASLVDGKVPSGQLPSYVDDVEEYVNRQNFPATGEKGKIYVDLSTNISYRWGGSEYVFLASDLHLGEAPENAYRGDRGKVAYDHATARGSSFTKGLYKIKTNNQGHVVEATAVVESDLTSLGVADEAETDNKLALKADRVNSAVTGNFAGLDAHGNLTDSGHKHADYMVVTQLDDTAGNGDTDKVWSADKIKTYANTELSKKTDKVTTAVESNFAGFDASGNLKDSGHKHADYMLAEQLDDTAGEGATGKVWSADKTKHYVDEAFTVNDAMLYKGVVNANSDLPANHKQGWTYKVGTPGLYAGKKCEVGDMIICNTDGTSAADSHWNVVQTNIDGAVTGPASSTDSHPALFDGTTGKVIKDGGTIQSLIIDDTSTGSDKVWSASKSKEYTDLVDTLLRKNITVWNGQTSYHTGQYVWYDDNGTWKLYRFNAEAIASGSLNPNTVDLVSSDLMQLIQLIEASIAQEFDDRAYVAGDCVMYMGKLYKYNVSHTAGSGWKSTQVSAITLMSLINESVVGPDSSTADHVALFNGTTGKKIKDGGTIQSLIIDDTAGDGDTTKVWSADKAYDTFATKADKVASATNGNFAGLNATGNLTDSGYTVDDTAGDGDTQKIWSANKSFDELALKAPKDNPEFTGSISLGRKSNTTIGDRSIAVGLDVEASGKYTDAYGIHTKAIGNSQIVFGMYNIEDKKYIDFVPLETHKADNIYVIHRATSTSSGTRYYTDIYKCLVDNTDSSTSSSTNWEFIITYSGNIPTNSLYPNSEYVEIVGNGKNNSECSNARALDWNGNQYLKGTLYVNGTNADATGGVEVAVKENPRFTGSISLGRSGDVGENSIAVGNSVKAEGKNSVAFGQDTRAIGRNQFVFGSGNVADITPDWNSSTQYYSGDRVSHNDSCWKALQDNINVMPGTNSLMWMRTSDNNYVEIVGIGSVTSPVTGRKLDWNGNEYLAGKLYISAGGYGAVGGKEVAVKDDPVFTGSLTLGNTTLTEAALQNLLSLTSANGVSF